VTLRRGPARPSQTVRNSRMFGREARALGQRVRALRLNRGWTLEVAAERMNLDLKHLQKIEAGSINVTLVTLVRIAAGFRQPIRVLFEVGGKGRIPE
jgi:transcriptional regulator with XRE-family HTH domain